MTSLDFTVPWRDNSRNHGGQPEYLKGSWHRLSVLLSLPWRSRWAEDTTPKHLYHTRTRAIGMWPCVPNSKMDRLTSRLSSVTHQSTWAQQPITFALKKLTAKCSPVQLEGQHALPSTPVTTVSLAHLKTWSRTHCQHHHLCAFPDTAKSEQRISMAPSCATSWRSRKDEPGQPASQRGSEPNDVNSSTVESNGNSSSLLL